MRSDYGIKRYVDETKRLYSVLESRLKESPYLAGSKYTIADIANYSWVQGAPLSLNFDLSEWPALEKWVEKIGERDAVKKGKKVPETGMTPEQRAEKYKEMRERIAGMTNADKR